MQRINHYPVDSMVCFVNIYPLDSDLSHGWRYLAFEQLGQETTEDVLAGKINKMAAMENILEEVYVRRFLVEENNSYVRRPSRGNQEPSTESKGL